MKAEIEITDPTGWGGARTRYTLIVDGRRGRSAAFDEPLMCEAGGTTYLAFTDYWDGQIATNTLFRMTKAKGSKKLEYVDKTK